MSEDILLIGRKRLSPNNLTEKHVVDGQNDPLPEIKVFMHCHLYRNFYLQLHVLQPRISRTYFPIGKIPSSYGGIRPSMSEVKTK